MDSSSSTQDADRLVQVLRENEELRLSVQQLREGLNEAEQQVRKSQATASSMSEQLQHFIYAAGHDLQEPIRTVKTNAQLLERQYPTDEYVKECTEFIIGAANRMTGLVQNLVAFSRVGTSRRRSVLKLSSPLQSALFKLAAAIRESSAQIKYQSLPEVQGDESELAQVFEHLLSNCLKFCSDVKPEIDICFAELSDYYVFSVRDNGIGIDPRYHEEVLLPFKRLNGSGVPGSGLGLAICQKVIHSHGGRIWVESDGSHGTTVHFTLPVC
jgi:signal transduction histidine kinase